MENKKIISYKAFLVPEMLTGVSFEEEFREGVHSLIMKEFVGSSVRIIFSQKIPAWNALIIFEELRRSCPEVCVRVGSLDLVLHSIFLARECFFAEDVVRFGELIDGGMSGGGREDFQEKIDFDFSENGTFQDGDVAGSVAEMKKITVSAEKVFFFGEADCVTVLVWYVLWMKRAKHLTYRQQGGEEYRFF